MSKKHRSAKKHKPAHLTPPILPEMSPLPQRYRNYSFEGRWLDHGIHQIDTEISQGGGVTTARAYINTMEAPALMGLFRAHVLDDARDSQVRHRRMLAGLEIRRIFQDSKMEAKSTGHYDKPLNLMLSSTQHPKSNEADNNEVEYLRLMKLCFPYNPVVRDVCCMDEAPPAVIRHGLKTPCSWKVALCRGLDIIAEDILNRRNRPRRRKFHRGPALAEAA